MTLLATTTVFGKEYYSPISVTDGTAADWDDLPAEYVASATHTEGCSYDGLKSVKVYCDDNYLNILLEVNLDVVTDLEWTLFHVFLNADGSSETGGYGDALFADADTEWMLETVIYANGYVNSYNPAVFKWWGEVGGSGWLWTDPDVRHDEYDCWGAIVCEGSYPAVGTSQMVDGDLGKVEIQLLKELIPAQWADEFTIGFDIQQSWTSCGILPNAPDDETGQVVRAEKLKVQVHHSSRLPQDGLYYEVTSNVEPYTVAVVGADADITTANIPETIEFIGKTFAVTSIGGEAFQYCSSLTSIAIPNSITSIGDNAFRGCSSLTSITIPNSVTSIGNLAFQGCTSLASVTIPNSVTSIGGGAFAYCPILTSIRIPSSVISIGEEVFSYCYSLTSVVVESDNAIYDSRENCNAIIETATNKVIAGCKKSIIPNSITSIGDEAFYGSSIASISIPNSVTSIGDQAFLECESLLSISIPNSVRSVGGNAFADCLSLVSVNMGNNITSIEDGTFEGCTSLATISLSNSIENIGEEAFASCTSLKSFTVPNSVKSIGEEAFAGCETLGTIVLGDKVKEIGNYAFNGCDKLYHIYCYAPEPPIADENVFTNYNVNLYVPCNYLDNYKYDRVFGSFRYIQCIESEDVTTDDVVVTPSTNDVTIIWPTEGNADTYTIVIKQDDEVFCTLTFNADGQLLNIAFAPGRDGNHPVQYAEQAVNGYRFTVTGLEEGTHYAYNIDVKDAADKTIKSYTGEFTTESMTAVENTHSQSATTSNQKILRDGQLLILKDGKTYNIMGAEIQ